MAMDNSQQLQELMRQVLQLQGTHSVIVGLPSPLISPQSNWPQLMLRAHLSLAIKQAHPSLLLPARVSQQRQSSLALQFLNRHQVRFQSRKAAPAVVRTATISKLRWAWVARMVIGFTT